MAQGLAPTAVSIGRAEWLRQRRNGIGGSDAAAVLGLSKWATPFDVWLQKRGEIEERPDSDRLWWGRMLEEPIAKRYTYETGRKLVSLEDMLAHPEHPELIANPDRIAPSDEIGVEIKTADVFTADQWGEPGTDEIPQAYVVQCLHYMAVTGFDRWDCAVLLGGSDFRIYTIRRDLALEREMIDRLCSWWRRHIIEGERPPIQASPETERWLKQAFPCHVSDDLAAADAEMEQALEALAVVRETLADITAQEAALENTIKAAIGDGAGLIGAKWKASWKKSAGWMKTDWEAVARDVIEKLAAGGVTVRERIGTKSAVTYSPVELLQAAIARHSHEQPGSRRFLFRKATAPAPKPRKGRAR